MQNVSRWFLETQANERSRGINRANAVRTNEQSVSPEKRIEDMDRMAERLSEIVPDAKLVQAHGRLAPSELERVRIHPYLTERMLASSSALAPLAAVAVQHHERLDGSGYPRGLTGADMTPSGRLLAAADSYHARLEPRPHRRPQPPDQAASELRADVRGGRIDGDAAEAILAAAGDSSHDECSRWNLSALLGTKLAPQSLGFQSRHRDHAPL